MHCPSQHSFSLRDVSRAPAPAALWGRALCEPCPKAPGTRGSALAQQSPLGKGRGGRNLPGSSPAMHQGGFGAAGTAALHLFSATSPVFGSLQVSAPGVLQDRAAPGAFPHRVAHRLSPLTPAFTFCFVFSLGGQESGPSAVHGRLPHGFPSAAPWFEAPGAGPAPRRPAAVLHGQRGFALQQRAALGQPHLTKAGERQPRHPRRAQRHHETSLLTAGRLGAAAGTELRLGETQGKAAREQESLPRRQTRERGREGFKVWFWFFFLDAFAFCLKKKLTEVLKTV